MRILRQVLLGAAVIAVGAAQGTPNQVEDTQRFDLKRTLATKTPYFDQRDDDLSPIKKFIKSVDTEKEEKYKFVQVQQVVRHGTRYPTDGNIEEILALLANLQTNYSSSIPEWLRSYQLPYNMSVEGTLAAAGVKELEGLGARTRKNVGQTLPSEFNPNQFTLQHTYKSRTKHTAMGFASKFFSNPQNVTYIEHAKKNDTLLRFYDHCPRYDRDVKKNKNATIEVDRFRESPTMKQHLETLRSNLKLPTDASLSVQDLESVFSACAFDIALYQRQSDWCTLLTPAMVESMDFLEDLEAFYEESHGFPINYEMASVLLKDIFQTMKDFVEGTSPIVGNFRFAHGETTLPLMTLLGYVDSKTLLASLSGKDIAKRKFRTSRLALFMANIEFRLYEKLSESKKKHYVQIRINEQVTSVPGCDDEVFCKLGDVEKIWDRYLKYDFDANCKI